MKKYLNLLVILSLLAFMISCGGDEKVEETPATDDTEMFQETLPEADTTEAETPDTSEVSEDKAPAPDTTPKDYTKTPMEGYIVSLDHLVMGGDGRVSKAEAEEKLSQGKILLFKSGSDVYFVLSEGGSYAGSQLAKYAAAPKVGLKGKIKKSNGVNMFMMTYIDAM